MIVIVSFVHHYWEPSERRLKQAARHRGAQAQPRNTSESVMHKYYTNTCMLNYHVLDLC